MGRHRCVICRHLSFNTLRVNGGPYHCYDGCYSATGRDRRTIDGRPAWEPCRIGRKRYKPFDNRRMLPEYQNFSNTSYGTSVRE